MKPTEDTPTPDLRKEYTDKVSKDFSAAGEHMIDPIARKQDDKQLREAKGDDYVYKMLMHLHRQEHIKDNCFCTTEVSGVYSKLLEEMKNRENDAQLQLVSELEGELPELPPKEEYTRTFIAGAATYRKILISVLKHKKQELEGKI